MDYDIGVRLDAVLKNQEKIMEVLNWVVLAMDDNNIKPKEEAKQNEQQKS